MAKIRIKRSATLGKVPLLIDLDLGELAANTYDGKIFFKRDNGTESIVKVLTDIDISQDNTLGANLTSANIIPSQKAVQEAVALNSSTGLIHGGILSINSPTTFNISGGEGVITDTSNSGRQQVFVNWAGVNDITPTNLLTNNVTYIAINENGEVVQQTTEYTTAQHRTLIIIGVIIHANFTTINNVNNTQHIVINPVNQLQDLAYSLGFINVNGNVYSSNGNNLKIDKSAGNLHGTGINYQNDDTNPNIKSTVSLSGLTFQYRKQDGISSANITDINPAIYDVNGVDTTVPNGKFTIQRIHLFPSNGTRIQPGQNLYDSIAHAISNIQLEEFVTEDNIKSNSLLRAFLIVRSDATNLSDKTQAFFLEAGKFNSVVGVGGLSVSSLQDAYNNAPQAVITTTDTIGPVVVKRGSASDTDTVFEIHDGNDNVVFDIKGDGTSDSLDAIFDTKVDKVAGYDLSKNDLTDELFGELSLQKYIRDEMESVVNVSGGIITPTGGITFSISPGVGYARDLTGKLVRVTWNTLTSSTINSGDNFINVDYAGNVVITSNSEQGDLIALGYISTALANTVIVGYSNARLIGKNHLFNIGEWLRSAVGTLVQAGCNTAMKPYPNELELTVSSGFIWTLLNRFTVTDKSTFTKLVKSSDYGFFVDSVTTANTVNTAYWNNTSNVAVSALVPMTPGYYKKDLIALTPEGTVFYIYANSEWATLDEAKSAPVPLVPDNIKLSVARSASLVSQEGATSVDTVIDIRPMISRLFDTGQAVSNATIISHSNLIDLGADDHLLYHTDARGDVRYYRKSDIDLLLLGKANSVHGHVAGDISGLVPSSVGLGNVQNVNQTIASNITSGTLSNDRLTNNLKEIGNATFNANDIVQHNGGVLTGITVSNLKGQLQLNNVANSLQVINAGNGVSFSSGPLVDRPIASVNGRLYATTNNGIFIDNGSSWVLQQAPISGDITISANSTVSTLATVNSNIGTFNNVTVNAKGLVTSASNVTYLTGNQNITLSGDFSGSGTTTITGTLATVNTNIGTFNNVTVNAKGLVTSASNVSYLTGNQSITVSGDLSGTGTTSIALTLATVNSNVGTFGSSNTVPIITTNAKGLITSVTTATITPTSIGLGNVANVDTTNASNITTGVLPLSVIPAGALDRLVIVANQTARFALTTATVQNGDTVKQNDTGLMYYVVDDTNLGNTLGYEIYTAGSATSVPYSGITSLPSNISQLSSITFSTNDLAYYNGSILTNISPTSYKALLSLTKSDVGLNNLTNSLQVINSGGVVSYASGNNASKPTAGTANRFYAATDIGVVYRDNGATWDAQLPAYTGDVTSTFGNSVLTLATVNSNVGTFNNVTVNAKGLVTAASNVSYLTGNQTITASGDITGSGTTSIALTLATVNSNVGTFGSTTVVPVITTNAKGLITSVSTAALTNASVGLGNVSNNLQVINSGGVISYSSGNNASKPIAGTVNRFYAATDIGVVYRDNGVTWDAQLPAYTGDVTSTFGNSVLTLATVNSNVGTFNNVTVNGKGLVTSASNVSYLTGNESITVTGDITGSGTTTLSLTLPNVNSNVGTFNNVNVNAKGQVIAATNVAYITGNQSITLSGDFSGTGTTSISGTLATVNSNVGSFGSTTVVPVITVNGKGLVTAVSSANLTSSSVGLGNVSNSLQVINAGGAVSYAIGTNASRPTFGTVGRQYYSTDLGITFYDTGTSWVAKLPAYTGDVTSSVNGTALTLATVNSNVGTFNNVTVNGKGLVTAASNVSYLTGNQSITLSGDFSGTGTTSISGTLATVNSNVGTFGSTTVVPVVTVNGKGLVTAVSTAALTNASVGLGNVANSLQVINTGNVVSIASGLDSAKPVAGTLGRYYNSTDIGGIYRDNGVAWQLQSIAYTGDVTSSVNGTVLTLATVNSNVGTFNNVTVNAKGLVTAASNVAYITGNQTITVTGDITGSGTTSIGLTLATVNSNVGTFGSTTVVPVITTNAKGLITAVSSANLTNASVGLGNVSNNLQVINAGNGVSFASGTLAARPVAATNGRLYATTNDGIYLDNGASWILQSPAYTGDVTKSANATALTLATVNSNIGTFNNITVNAKGLATAASNVDYLLDPAENGIVVRTALNTTGWRAITGTANQTSITNGDGVAGNPTIAIASNPVLPGTASTTIPIGTTAERDTATNGQLRFNSTLGYAETSSNNVYHPLGKVIQFISGDIVQTTGTTILPHDATLPTSAEGFQIWTANITPTYTTSTIVIIFNVYAECSLATATATLALFNGTTAISIAAGRGVAANTAMNLSLSKRFVSGTISPITLSARIGPSAAATVYVNRGNTETFGGTTNSSYIIMEII